MVPEEPSKLLARLTDVLRARGAKVAPSLAESLGGEVWIDFIADTGDDVTVSERVCELFAATYDVENDDGTKTHLPRGHVLLLGGDLAYPVATVREMTRRLIEPWNHVLEAEGPAPPRAMLAVPGNHDWYDGLDGFARLCQAPLPFEEGALPSVDPLHPQTSEFPVIAWAEAFARGEAVKKPGRLALFGYEPTQRASYFRLALAPGLDLCGVDRQLRLVDPRQRAYFEVAGARSRLVVMPDPIRAWGEERPHGRGTLRELALVPNESPMIVLAGDIHHYERSQEGPSLHVVAGGGGAFLQGARIAPNGQYRIDAEFPGPAASKRMLLALPWHMGSGKAGILVPLGFALFHGAALLGHSRAGLSGSLPVAIAASVTVGIFAAMLLGWRQRGAWRVLPVSFLLGAVIGALPASLGIVADRVTLHMTHGVPLRHTLSFVVAWLLSIFWSGFFFGGLLAAMGLFGWNHAQPYAALGIAGFKHFLRIRIRATGDPHGHQVDAWAIGLVDPVGQSPPVLVDHFAWGPGVPIAGRKTPA